MRELKRKGRALFQRVKPTTRAWTDDRFNHNSFPYTFYFGLLSFFAYNTLGFTGNLAFNMTPKDMKQGWSFPPFPLFLPIRHKRLRASERASSDRASLVRVSKSQRMGTSPRTCLPHTTKRPTKRATDHHSARSSGISLSLLIGHAHSTYTPTARKFLCLFCFFWALFFSLESNPFGYRFLVAGGIHIGNPLSSCPFFFLLGGKSVDVEAKGR